jgi:hypothetical protein
MIRPVAAAIVVLALAGGAGCSKKPHKQPLAPSEKFSVNVVPTPAFWPRDKFDWPENPAERRAREEAWATHGTPDYIRFVHTVDRRIIRPLEIAEGHTLPGRLPEADTEWVYFADKKVVSFSGTKVTERPLDDMLSTVCLYGDPNEVKTFTIAGGERKTFTYYNHGRTFTFADDKIISTQEHPPMPGFEMRN